MAKALGIVRKVDELGRVVIPMEVRKSLGWKPGTPLEMFATDKGMSMQEYGRENEAKKVLEGLYASISLTEDPEVKSVLISATEFIEKEKH